MAARHIIRTADELANVLRRHTGKFLKSKDGNWREVPYSCYETVNSKIDQLFSITYGGSEVHVDVVNDALYRGLICLEWPERPEAKSYIAADPSRNFTGFNQIEMEEAKDGN